MLFREKVFAGVVECCHSWLRFFEGVDGDVAVLPKPLILNPAGTEGQILINGLMATELSIGWPPTGLWEIGARFTD